MRFKLAALLLAASCICASAQTINGTPTSLFYTGLTAQGINTDGISTLLISGSPAYTGTGTFAGIRDNSVYTMSGSSTPNVDSILINAHITGAANLANYEGVMVNQTLDAGYTGTGTAIVGFENNLLTNNSTLKIPNYRGFLDDAKSAGTGCASGTCTSIQFAANGLTGASGGGTLNNYDYYAVVPSGGAVTGTTNNRGIYITGNGGTNAGGTTNNFALYSDSTVGSTFAGPVRLGGISTLTFPTLGLTAGLQLFAIDATTINDSTDSGTVATINLNKIFGTALTSTSAVTGTTVVELDVEPPTCSGNMTCSNLYAMRIGGAALMSGGALTGTGNIVSNTSTSFQLTNTTATATVPDVIINRGDTTTGVGGASGHAALIAGGVNQVDCISTGCTIPLVVTLQAGITETGATASLNASSNFGTNINTGTSSGTITLGNSGNTAKLIIADTATDSGQAATRTFCEDTTTHTVYFGSGTAGVCKGTSSRSVKTGIFPIKADLSKLDALPILQWHYAKNSGMDTEPLHYGPMAEDVAKAIPALGMKDKKGKITSYDWPALLFAMQARDEQRFAAQQKEIGALKVEIAALRARH